MSVVAMTRIGVNICYLVEAVSLPSSQVCCQVSFTKAPHPKKSLVREQYSEGLRVLRLALVRPGLI